TVSARKGKPTPSQPCRTRGGTPMKKLLALALFPMLAAALSVPAFAKKYPEPSPFPISWELKFEHAKPKRIVVDSVPYWYLTYSVENDTKDDQEFLPVFEMATNEGQKAQSDMTIPCKVFNRIKQDEGDALLESAVEIAGTVHPG